MYVLFAKRFFDFFMQPFSGLSEQLMRHLKEFVRVFHPESSVFKIRKSRAFCKNMRYLFSFDLIPYLVIAPSSISGLLHHMPYF